MPRSGLTPALLGDVEDPLQLGDLLEDQDDGLAHPDAVEGEPDEGLVLVAVRRDEAVRAEVRRERREELGLGPGLEAVAVLPARLDDLVHDDLLLVHLDREDAAVDAVVVVLLDGVDEGVVQLPDGRGEDLREADDDGRRDAAEGHVVDDALQVDEAVRSRASGGRGGSRRRRRRRSPFPSSRCRRASRPRRTFGSAGARGLFAARAGAVLVILGANVKGGRRTVEFSWIRAVKIPVHVLSGFLGVGKTPP